MQTHANPSSQAPAQCEVLTCRIGAEDYGIEILKVQEIRGYESPTVIANTPPFIKGVINLRGVIVPIVDLRTKFAVGQPTYDQFTVVIILNMIDRVVGIVVDSVADVTAILPEQIHPAPEFSASLGVDHITGLGTVGDRMLILLDIEALMCSEHMALKRLKLDS
jgi:purine-binding chemotaxis protein CheW